MNIHPSINTSERGRTRKEFQGKVWTEENIAIAAKMYADGYFGSHIAKHFGVTRNSFCGLASRNRHLFPKRAGSLSIPQTRTGAKWTKEKLDECLRMRKEGKTMKVISNILGVTETAVAHVVRKHRAVFETDTPAEPEPTKHVARRTYIAGEWVEHVKRKTQSGAVVTMPRVSFIDGVGEQG